VLVAVMGANNEVGTVQPIGEIGEIAARTGALLHCDATQAAGRIPFDVRRDGVHLASVTAHKVYGPKGCGALYVRGKDPAVAIAPRLHGGGQEHGLRAGTLNVPGIVGLGMAAEISRLELAEEAPRIAGLRDRLRDGLLAGLDGVTINGDRERRVPGNLHVSFDGVDGQALMMALPGLAVSSGSACASGRIGPSHVLEAMGIPAGRALSSLRFGVGRFNTMEEIDRTLELVVDAVRRLRAGRNRRAGSGLVRE
jgi:cysteine desulfurase